MIQAVAAHRPLFHQHDGHAEGGSSGGYREPGCTAANYADVRCQLFHHALYPIRISVTLLCGATV